MNSWVAPRTRNATHFIPWGSGTPAQAVIPNPSGADGPLRTGTPRLGRASTSMGKKDRIRHAGEIRNEALRTLQLQARRSLWPFSGSLQCRDHAAVRGSRFFAKILLGAGVFEDGVICVKAVYNIRRESSWTQPDLSSPQAGENYADQKQYQGASRCSSGLVDYSLPPREIMDSDYTSVGSEFGAEAGQGLAYSAHFFDILRRALARFANLLHSSLRRRRRRCQFYRVRLRAVILPPRIFSKD